MNKYRVLKKYPKQITNSGRMVTLKPGSSVYLKKEGQVLRLVRMGYIKPIVELPKKKKPKKVKAQPKPEVAEVKSEKQYKKKKKDDKREDKNS